MLKLREGKDYKFLVEKDLTLPDNSRHFLLKGPDEKKYLIPAGRYSYYGIVTGSVIICRVDRRNCKGEVFLEPRNPWYSEGKSYSFTVEGTEIRTDTTGINHKVVVVTDRAGNRISVPHDSAEPFPVNGTKLNLIVERITKGKIHLVAVSRALRDYSLKAGRDYEFVIERIEKGMDDEEYFVVKDPFGNLHTLAREFYEYYGYTVGTRFRGILIKYNNNGEKTIEPANPFYKIGSVIKMNVTGFTENIINPSFTINLKDKFGFTHCIETSTPPEGNSVSCRVVMIKKGKPLLYLL
jgi:hypothetical protein